MGWEKLIGQHRVKTIIKKIIEQDRLPHALLFYGPGGVGKDAAAVLLGKTLNCQSGQIDPCNICSDCRKFDLLQHPNLNLVYALPVGKNETSDDSPTAKLTQEDMSQIYSELELKGKNLYHNISIERANNIKITSIREIRKKTSLSAYEQGKKIFLIVDAEKMNDQASNALLKTLEEPVGNTLLILTTSNKDALLPTIISRCQLIRFDELTESEIAEALKERENIDETQSKIIARLSNGSYIRALELIGEDLNKKREDIVDFLVIILTQDQKKIYEEIEKILKEFSKTEVEQFILLLEMWFRDINSLYLNNQNILNIDQISRLEKFSAKYPNVNIQNIFQVIDRALLLLKKNVYLQLILLSIVINFRKIILTKI